MGCLGTIIGMVIGIIGGIIGIVFGIFGIIIGILASLIPLFLVGLPSFVLALMIILVLFIFKKRRDQEMIHKKEEGVEVKELEGDITIKKE